MPRRQADAVNADQGFDIVICRFKSNHFQIGKFLPQCLAYSRDRSAGADSRNQHIDMIDILKDFLSGSTVLDLTVCFVRGLHRKEITDAFFLAALLNNSTNA